MDDSELRPIDPFGLLDVESARIDNHLARLHAGDWTRRSRCAGWSTRDVLAHLVGVEEYNRACLDDDLPEAMAKGAEAGATDVDGFNEWFIGACADRTTADLLTEWREANADFRRRMHERGRDGTMSTSIGTYPVGWQAFHLASELATHADDIGAWVARDERGFRTNWRARFSRFAIVEAERPVEIEVEDGRNRVRAAGQEALLTDEELVEAAMGRLPADHRIPEALREALDLSP